MSLHESIMTDLHDLIEDQGGVDIISPTSLALAAQARYAETGQLPAQIAYTSLEHFKQLARKVLAGRYSAESDEAEVYVAELFSGHLQARYPVPRKKGDEPTYKRLEALTDEEIRWNEQALERSADARMDHARALKAYRMSRVEVA